MKFNDVIKEAQEWGAEVVFCDDGFIEFHYNDETSVMHHTHRRKWTGTYKSPYSWEKYRKDGLKGSVAEWCLASVIDPR